MTPEDVKAASDKINKIVETVEKYKEQIEKIKNEYVDKINGYIEDLETIINSGATKSVQYIEMKTKVVMEKIDKALDSLRKTLKDIMDKITDWFQIQTNKIKESTVKSALAKIGMSVNEVPEMLLNMIPTPSISLSVPSIPDSNKLLGDKIASVSKKSSNEEIKEYVKLPRLEI